MGGAAVVTSPTAPVLSGGLVCIGTGPGSPLTLHTVPFILTLDGRSEGDLNLEETAATKEESWAATMPTKLSRVFPAMPGESAHSERSTSGPALFSCLASPASCGPDKCERALMWGNLLLLLLLLFLLLFVELLWLILLCSLLHRTGDLLNVFGRLEVVGNHIPNLGVFGIQNLSLVLIGMRQRCFTVSGTLVSISRAAALVQVISRLYCSASRAFKAASASPGLRFAQHLKRNYVRCMSRKFVLYWLYLRELLVVFGMVWL